MDMTLLPDSKAGTGGEEQSSIKLGISHCRLAPILCAGKTLAFKGDYQ